MTRQVTITNTSNWEDEPIKICFVGKGDKPDVNLNPGESYTSADFLTTDHIGIRSFRYKGKEPKPMYRNGKQVAPKVFVKKVPIAEV